MESTGKFLLELMTVQIFDQPPNKSLVGLNNVDNTSDLNKPLSTAVTNILTDYLQKFNPSAVGSFTLQSNDDYTLAEIME